MSKEIQQNLELIGKIADKLVFGDRAKIARNLKHTTSYVIKVLKLTTPHFSQRVLDEAMVLIEEREKKQRAFIKRLSKGENKRTASKDAVLSINTGNI
jgi:hypothetical protein